MKFKICTKCKKELNIENFHKDKQKKDGYTSTCKECNIKKTLKYYNTNTEKCNERLDEINLIRKYK